MSILSDILGKAIEPITDLINNLHTSEEEKLKASLELTKINNELQIKIMEAHDQEMQHQKEIILAEANGGWLQRNWRPILMISMIAILVNNYIIAPYLGTIFPNVVKVLEFPEQFWWLLIGGVCGYVGLRTYEKKQGL